MYTTFQVMLLCALFCVVGAGIFMAGFLTCRKVMIQPVDKMVESLNKIDKAKEEKANKFKEEIEKRLYSELIGPFDPITPKEQREAMKYGR